MGNTLSFNSPGFQKCVVALTALVPISAIYENFVFSRSYNNLHNRISDLESAVYSNERLDRTADDNSLNLSEDDEDNHSNSKYGAISPRTTDDENSNGAYVPYYTLYIYVDCDSECSGDGRSGESGGSRSGEGGEGGEDCGHEGNGEGGDELKSMYLNAANKHNDKVDKYIRAINTGKLNCDNMNDYCYDSGFDLFCPKNVKITNKNITYMLDHKVKCAMKYNSGVYDYGYCGYYLYLRSGTPVKTPLRLANSVGIIDSGYRGNIMAYFDNKLYNNNVQNSYFSSNEIENSFNLEFGNRFVQICPPDLFVMRVEVVDSVEDLGNTERGRGGFGSTGE